MDTVDLVSLLFESKLKGKEIKAIEIYAMALKDIPLELLKKGIMRCVQEEEFLPSIATIRKKCESLVEEVQGTKVLPWDQAWEIIYKGWCEGSPYKPDPDWKTPEIAQTVHRFGWHSLLEAPADQTMAIRAQMKVMYENICSRAKEHTKNQNVLRGKSGFEGIGSVLKGLSCGELMLDETDYTNRNKAVNG